MRIPNSLELFLIQTAAYLALWLVYPYLAGLLSIIFGIVFLVVLLISLVVEWIEPSKVPRAYFRWMLASTLAPGVAALAYEAGKWFGGQ
ncbi:MAG: hypothetical protein KIPDCIKN_00352 [Haliscomenobacter sp.]|jgi:hypothetical protein|nr:hypothetical protein [Haliscomenobacter sp.]